MKKILLATTLSVILLTTGCQTNSPKTNDSGSKANTAVKSNNELPIEKEEELTEEDNATAKEKVQNLMSNSDYISRVKLTQLGDTDTELKIIENYKGSLSTIEFTSPKDLKTNREYLVFYKDDENGNIVPTNGDSSFIEVASTNDTILNYIEETYVKTPAEDEDEDEKKSSDSKEDTNSSKETKSSKTSGTEKKTASNTSTKESSDNKSTAKKTTSNN